jgi:hypothetical protein
MHYLTLPGELRNAIYDALLTSSTSPDALRLSKAGVLVAPTLAHTNNLIRRELTSLLEHKNATILEAQAFDFNTAPLHAFLLTHPSKQTTTVKLTLHLTAPGAEKAYYAALRAFLVEAQAMGWSVGYRVKFDWGCWSIGEAAQCARDFASAFMPGGVAGSAGEGLWRALKKAREAEVRRCLVERPSRQRALMAEGRGRVFMME